MGMALLMVLSLHLDAKSTYSGQMVRVYMWSVLKCNTMNALRNTLQYVQTELNSNVVNCEVTHLSVILRKGYGSCLLHNRDLPDLEFVQGVQESLWGGEECINLVSHSARSCSLGVADLENKNSIKNYQDIQKLALNSDLWTDGTAGASIILIDWYDFSIASAQTSICWEETTKHTPISGGEPENREKFCTC